MTLQTGEIPFTQKQGRVFMQRTPFNSYFLLSDHGMNGINWPSATRAAVRSQSNRFRAGSRVIDISAGDTELAAFTVLSRLTQTTNILMAIEDEFVHVQLLTGPSGIPTQYGAADFGLAWVLTVRGPATTGEVASVSNEGEAVQVTMDAPFSAVMGPIPIDWTVALTRPTTAEDQAMTGIAVLPEFKDNNPSRKTLAGQVGAICCDAVAVGTANVYYFTDGLLTAPTLCAADPFAADDNCTDIVMYGDRRDFRMIAFGDDVALPACAYSDDKGATWSGINMGAVAADIPNEAFIVDASQIYAVGGQAASSKVWISNDGAATWTEYDPGLAQPLRDVEVAGNGVGWIVGDSNTVGRITAFNSIASVTGPSGGAGDALLAVGIKWSDGTVLIGNDAGELYSSEDDGETWTTRTATIQGVTATAINQIRFDPSGEFGYMEVTTASDRVWLRTTDGGASWKNYNLSNAGLSNVATNAIVAIGANHVLGVGAVSGGTATIRKAQSTFDGSQRL